ncbi:hypothetical protein [Streptomyces sp. NPDC060194]|uniref:hypothetical protein n=1 Tax=Streptomyces sp. NPDC060194 TaxID=3347069 RepID=UPI00364EC819
MGATGCGDSDNAVNTKPTTSSSPRDPSATATATSTAERQKLAKTRFVANAGLAAGAAYQWIVKPYRDGKFKEGADGRRFALVKAGLAGAFTYNRLQAALKNAEGDPTLSKALAPLQSGVDSLKDLPAKLRKGEGAGDISATFGGVIDKVKSAAGEAGAKVEDRVPSTSQLTAS